MKQTLASGAVPASSFHDDLVRKLERVLTRRFDQPQRIVHLDVRPSPYRSSFALDELTVELSSGRRLLLVMKDSGWSTLDARGRSAKPYFLHNPLREIATYEQVLRRMEVGAPRYYGSSISPGKDRYWLFLERVDGCELYQVGEIEQWRQVAAWLADFHAATARLVATQAAPTGSWLRYDREFYWRWLHRAEAFRRSRGGGGPEEDRLSRRLRARYDEVVDRLLAMPRTLIHGEFYASNIIVSAPTGGARVCPLDWETTAVGPGLVDLAALTAGGWSETERVSIGLAYYEAREQGPSPLHSSFESFMEDLTVCRLHLAVLWLGWAEHWEPPPDHQNDWWAEARRLADELGF
jgi:Ser/Thr protein kinase RdoA (MazF antagonist)